MLEKLMKSMEKQMLAQLEQLREAFKHSGNKGSTSEELLREFLRKYLPRRLDVGEGEIIDTTGNRTGQCDIIVVNEDHPFTWTQESPGLFFVEGVSAVGEVKTVLTSTELTNSLKNSVRHKALKLVHAKGTQIHSNPSDHDRFYDRPPSFLFAFESQLSLETITKKVIEFRDKEKLEDVQILDSIFVLNKGWICDFGDGKGSFQYITPEGKPLSGWIYKESENILNDLLIWLSIIMPKFQRFESIIIRYLMGNIK